MIPGADRPPDPAQSRTTRSGPPREGAAPRARRRGLGQDARHHAPAGAARPRRRGPAHDRGRDVHEQGGGGDARAGADARSAERRSAPSSGRSTRGACASCAGGRARRSCRRASRSPTPPTSSRSSRRRWRSSAISTDVLPPNSVRSRISAAKNALVSAERFAAHADRLRRRADRAGLRPLREEARGDRRPRLRRPDRPLGAAPARPAPPVAAEERRRVRHLLIDEYQDTNTSQDALVKLLGRRPIPSARSATRTSPSTAGAAPRSSTSSASKRTFRGRGSSRSRRNYRSTAKILAAASGLVSHNRRRREKRLRADRGAGAAVRLWRFDEDRDRDRGGGARDRGLGRPPGEVAILYRTNAQSRPFEEELVRRRIPYVVVGGMKFYERAEVKDVLAYLRLAARPEDDLAFRRVVNVPARGIGAATLDKLAAAVRETGKSWWEVSAEPAGRSGPRAHGARALPRRRRGPPREGRDVDAVGAARAPARGHRLRRALRGLRGPRGRRAPREHPRAALLRARVRAPQRRGRDRRGVPRHGLARDERGRRRERRGGDALDAPRRQGARVPAGLRRRARGRVTSRTASPPRTRTSSRRSGGCSTSG